MKQITITLNRGCFMVIKPSAEFWKHGGQVADLVHSVTQGQYLTFKVS